MKKAEFWSIKPKFLTKKINQKNQQCVFVFENKINNTIPKNFNKFLQNWRKFMQKVRKMWIKATEFALLFSEV